MEHDKKEKQWGRKFFCQRKRINTEKANCILNYLLFISQSFCKALKRWIHLCYSLKYKRTHWLCTLT